MSLDRRIENANREGELRKTEEFYVREPMRVYWDEYEPQDRGVCRRYPPHPYHRSPTVSENHYCGEWRPILESRNISAYLEE